MAQQSYLKENAGISSRFIWLYRSYIVIAYSETSSVTWAELPFISITERVDGTAAADYWSVESSGAYAADCVTGREFAAEFIVHLQQTDNRPLFNAVMRAACSVNDPTGVEIGLMSAIAGDADNIALILIVVGQSAFIEQDFTSLLDSAL
jgi:hypothetical protein